MKCLVSFVALSVLISLLATQSEAGVEEYIYNGYNATKGMFPWYTFLYLKNDEGHAIVCGGSVLSDTWILTAGHCTLNIKSGEARIGAYKISDFNESWVYISNIESTHVHPNYNNETEWMGVKQKDFDVALFKLEKPIPFKDYPNIKPISLPPTSLDKPEYLTHQYGVLAGWGHINDAKEFPKNLQYELAQIGTRKRCKEEVEDITENMVCAYRRINHQGFCQGDSGGGLVMRTKDKVLRVVATVSFHIGTCSDSVNVYAFIGSQPILSWIMNSTGIKPE